MWSVGLPLCFWEVIMDAAGVISAIGILIPSGCYVGCLDILTTVPICHQFMPLKFKDPIKIELPGVV